MRPLHGTEIPTLQAPLTTPTGDTATISVTLPRELVERILILLDIKSILRCRLVNREFNEIIQSSIVLQYFLACNAAGVIDNPQSPFSYAERLEALKKREDAWRQLKPVFEMSISVNHRAASKICRSTGGTYLLSDSNWRDLNYCHLTSFPQDNPRWIRIPGHGPALNRSEILVNCAAALYEHDLIVNLISCDIENQEDMQRHSVDLVLLKFSTGEYHPLARRPQIRVQISPGLPRVEPWVVSRIAGNNLALVIHSDDGAFSDKLFIFNWKTGHKLLEHEATQNAYSDLIFLSPELLLVPNSVLFHFEVWHLPTHRLGHKPPIQILSLKIPALSPEYSFVDFSCYGEPNPFLNFTLHFPPQPFFSSPEKSIVVVGFRMSSNSHGRASYNLIMHRRAILDTIQKWTAPSLLEQQESLPTWLTNEVTVHQTVDPEDGSLILDAQSNIISTIPHCPRSSSRTRDFPTLSATFQNSRTFDSGSSSVSSNSFTSRYNYLRVQWAEWGPPISRWFQLNETQAWEAAVSNGQRYAFSDPNPRDPRKLVVSVADFNPHNFGRNAEMMTRLRSEGGESNGNNKEEEEEEEFEILDHEGVFSEEVYMGLKCVVYRAPDEYGFDAVMIDEQRLLGVKLNRNGLTESIKVLYIG